MNKTKAKVTIQNEEKPSLYKELLRHPKWQRKRLEKMEDAGWQCEICAANDECLEIHHKHYHAWPNGNLVEPWLYKPQELECLCSSCHTLTHIDREKILRFVKARNLTE